MVILLVEDSEDDQIVFQRAVRKAGDRFVLKMCSTAQDALLYLSTEGAEIPSLILSDLTLPGVNGVEFIALCRSLLKDQPVTIIAMSSDASPVRIQEALTAGAQTYLLKPTEYDAFVSAVIDTIHEVAAAIPDPSIDS